MNSFSCCSGPNEAVLSHHEVEFLGGMPNPTKASKEVDQDELWQAEASDPVKCVDPVQPQVAAGWHSIKGLTMGTLTPKPPLLIRAMSALTIDSKGNETRSGEVHEASSPASFRGGFKVLRRSLSNMSKFSKRSGKSHKSGVSGEESGSSRAGSDEDPTGDEGARKISIHQQGATVSPQSVNSAFVGHPNKIRTTKYTWLTWIPKSLYAQFKRVANVYFGFICLIVLFPWSPKDPRSKVGPFMMVLLWTCLKDLYEDNRRRKDDDKENQQDTWRWDWQAGRLVKVLWQDILTGDVVLVPNNGTFPADLLMVWSKDDREAFMSTVMLDGETSLKERVSQKNMDVIALKARPQQEGSDDDGRDTVISYDSHFDLSDVNSFETLNEEITGFMTALQTMGVEIEMGAPSEILANVRGRLLLGAQAPGEGANHWKAILETNFLPRGCVLKNTPWVLGLTLYTGSSTKTRMKASVGTAKFSNMQVALNYCIRGLLGVLVIVCAYLATAAKAFGNNDESWAVMFLMYLIAIYHVVPMSLYIVYEVLKLILGYQVNMDPQMVDPDTGMSAVARTADLMEEMGQIDFVFSDKTGTLTKNEMIFARCHVAGEDLGDFRTQEGIERARKLVSMAEDSEPAMAEAARWMFTCLAICHSVVVNPKAKASGEFRYAGPSPDEVALVQAAHQVGVSFELRLRKRGTESQELTIQIGSTVKKLTLLHELEFTSDRKRMSVIVKMDGKVWCITKGADNVMEELLSAPLPAECKADIHKFSRQGLRTLLVAAREIPYIEYQGWTKKYEAAKRILDNTKEQRIKDEAAKIEVGLHIVGATAVEDKLQDGVVEAIETIKQAGIRLWMLTGDKLETAVDIARSCNLFTEATKLSIISGAKDDAEVLHGLEAAAQEIHGKEASEEAEFGLVIDGKSLYFAMQSMDCRQLIFDLGMKSKTCVCCRLSPAQKLQLVQLVRSVSPSTITLSIGDGANDVPMIEGAHLGVAIRGKEGAQAVQASDIAISQFRFLVPLLLCHGRRAYRRIALFVNYYLYKNVALVMGDLIWAHQQNFKGQIAFPEYLSISFNGFFTSWHILFAVGFDYDMSDSKSNANPHLYRAGPARTLFNAKIFTKWMVYAIIHGTIAWVVPLEWYGDKHYVKEEFTTFWISSVSSFIIVILIVMLKLFVHSVSPFKMTTWIPVILSILFVFPVMLILAYTPIGLEFQPNMEGLPGELFTNGTAVLSMFIIPPAALTLDIIERILFPSSANPEKVELNTMG